MGGLLLKPASEPASAWIAEFGKLLPGVHTPQMQRC